MLFYKKYLKYKQKYLLKKQYGGVLSDEITSIIPYIQELEKYKITLEPVLTSNLSRLILDVKQFYRLKLSEIAQQRVLIQQTKHDNDCNEIPDIIIDTHFKERNRNNRLEMAVSYTPKKIGLGISEDTVIIFKGLNICAISY